ncbi:hypothetical protein C8T65DRAFT_577662 [Cerioporus squamosus]|nr:hypothetical protein C8T65DRAFT_577662 [Cerioporus squamosus]
MSAPALKKNYYLIQVPDLPNAQRAKHNTEHMAYWGPLIQRVSCIAAGGLLPQAVQSSNADAITKVSGSFLVIQADTAEQAWETFKKDVFWTSGEVLDRERATLIPVYVGVPKVE